MKLSFIRKQMPIKIFNKTIISRAVFFKLLIKMPNMSKININWSYLFLKLYFLFIRYAKYVQTFYS